jgi:hypothetical protein
LARIDRSEEQTEREWHFWLFALLLVGGGLLVVFPPGFWPDLGFAIVAGAASAPQIPTATIATAASATEGASQTLTTAAP